MAAEHEDEQLGNGHFPDIVDIADRARMTIEEAQRHVDWLVREKLAGRTTQPKGHLHLHHDEIAFARRAGRIR